MLAEGSLKSDQIKLLKDRIAFQEAERTDLERRLHLLEGQFEAEKQAREELEHVKDNLVVQRQEAEGGYKLLLNELKLTKGKYFDEKGKRIQTEGVAKALEKDRQVTESEKVDALKAKEQLKKSKEQLVQGMSCHVAYVANDVKPVCSRTFDGVRCINLQHPYMMTNKERKSDGLVNAHSSVIMIRVDAEGEGH